MPRTVDALIAEVPLRAGEVLRVTVGGYRATQYVHVRRYYQQDGRWLPGKGAAFRACLLPFVLNALRTAEGELLRAGLLELEDYAEHDLPAPPELRPRETE